MNNADISVLLVDDDEMIRDCMTAYLDDEGFRVLSASGGEEALDMLTSIAPTVCISDMRLPGMNGEEFIIKAFMRSPSTRFLLHTGMMYTVSDELRQIGLTADEVLLKPIYDLSKLVKKIRNIAVAGRIS
jgi:DNA-binding response OmpR family regulator